MNKILIIEDDLEINALLADFLKEKDMLCIANMMDFMFWIFE